MAANAARGLALRAKVHRGGGLTLPSDPMGTNKHTAPEALRAFDRSPPLGRVDEGWRSHSLQVGIRDPTAIVCAINALIRLANASRAKGLVITCIPTPRSPSPTTAVSA